MFAVRRHFHRLTWLALLAVLALALAPTVSRALTAGAGFDARSALCSAAGSVPQEPAETASDGHCPLCGPGSAALLAPSAVGGPDLEPGTDRTAPARPAQTPRTRLLWASAAPRAPPAAA